MRKSDRSYHRFLRKIEAFYFSCSIQKKSISSRPLLSLLSLPFVSRFFEKVVAFFRFSIIAYLSHRVEKTNRIFRIFFSFFLPYVQRIENFKVHFSYENSEPLCARNWSLSKIFIYMTKSMTSLFGHFSLYDVTKRRNFRSIAFSRVERSEKIRQK